MAVTTTYQNIAMVIGEESAQKLIGNFGGTELYVHTCDRLPPNHQLVTILGEEVAKRLCHYYGGRVLDVPLNKQAVIKNRNAEIIKLAKDGVCPNDLAKRFTLHVRTIRKIIEKDIKERANAVYAMRQFSLF
ncbi:MULTISPECIES: Mor transcription activator family protein [unclassified Moraxella]|uniref:Mor transcription activator family protein n=1 Tax=unclassified Moraxella TaxID=2685852 RepID=UPI003AF4D7A8